LMVGSMHVMVQEVKPLVVAQVRWPSHPGRLRAHRMREPRYKP
jgi:hypothetical protein